MALNFVLALPIFSSFENLPCESVIKKGSLSREAKIESPDELTEIPSTKATVAIEL